MKKRITKRQFLKILIFGGGLGGIALMEYLIQIVKANFLGLDSITYLPIINKNEVSPTPSKTFTRTATRTFTPTSSNPRTATATGTRTVTGTATTTRTATGTPTSTKSSPDGKPKVIHIHSSSALSWAGQADYWNYVDQNVVNNMVDQGIMTLTGKSNPADGWKSLLPSYQIGQKIAIKANFNNSADCGNHGSSIDGLIHPVNGVVKGLKQIGVSESDIRIYDAVRIIPNYFVNGCLYSGVMFYDQGCSGHLEAGWSNSIISFHPPSGVPSPQTETVTQVLVDASYLIDMPILKPHSATGITLSFKNHFGSIYSPEKLHDYVIPGAQYFRSDYNPLVDIWNNPHFGAKTILIMGDGLFAAKSYNSAPQTWVTFGNNTPKSLFFATDPVAIDCVMCDFLSAELTIDNSSDYYLRIAGNAGLGIYERGAPWGAGYSKINYSKIEI